MAANNLWVQTSEIGPSPRAGHKMVYDSDRKVTVMFGGITTTDCLNDTWEWDGEVWTQVADTGPAKRYLHVMAYDSARKKTVLFGGYFFPFVNQPEVFYTDTWEWDGVAWTNVAENGLRTLWPAMAYDSNDKKSILYGSIDGTRATWAWDGTEWQKKSLMGPIATQKHDMCFNSITNTILLYGGFNNGAVFSQTWEWDGAFWKQLSDFGPKPLQLHALTFNGKNAVLFGGEATANGAPLNETWQWNGRYWTMTQYFGPGPRMSHAMCTDTGRNKIVLFGGGSSEINETLFNDTWEIDTD